MKFNIRGTDVYVSFSFLVVFIFVLMKGNLRLYFSALVFSMIHEIVHLTFLLIFKMPVKQVSFSIFGGNISREMNSDSYTKEAIINLSAPIVNIVIGVVFLFIKAPEDYAYINLFIGLFNICPFYSFDGGKGLRNILMFKYDKSVADSVIYAASIVVLALFSVINFAIIKYRKVNLILVAINIYLVCCFIVNLFKKDTVEA